MNEHLVCRFADIMYCVLKLLWKSAHGLYVQQQLKDAVCYVCKAAYQMLREKLPVALVFREMEH